MNFILLELGVIFQVSVALAKEEDFIINTSKCKLPSFPAFSEEVNSIYIPQNYTKCSNLEPLTYTTVINNIAYLHIKKENAIYYSSKEELSCCHSYVTRTGLEDDPDVGISISYCQDFKTSVRLYRDTVIVNCFKGDKLVYENVHNPITISTPVKEKLKKTPVINRNQRPISVLFVVIDSVSRLNLIRTMPKTRNFLLQNNFIEFTGYNKIDDNTFPNFNALLTGLNLTQSLSRCKPTKVGGLDRCPMIWYDFKKAGYVTAYAEDWASLSTFNYFKKGFKDPPTDYYFKPYVEAAETLNTVKKDAMPYCAGPETEGERILNLAKDFSVTFKGQPSFGIFWMNTFSHDYINSPNGMDEKVRQFFQDMRSQKIFNDSVIILLSDHGMRFGKIRTTVQGWYEERLPVNLISVPPWVKTKYPSKYDNLKKNAKKLTSTYDLYMTLQDILEMSVQNYSSSPSLACRTCSSLFSKIPEDRSCQEAGIPEIWCTCFGKFDKYDSRINKKISNKAAKLALDEIKYRNKIETSSSVTNILSSSISSVSPTKGYFLIVIETDESIPYQVLFKIDIKQGEVEFRELIQLVRLY